LQFKKGEIKVGDLACFIPADSLVPVSRPEFAFMAGKADESGYARVRGIRLRKLPSVGLLLRCPDGIILPNAAGTPTWSHKVQAGDDLQHWYGIKKYEPPQTHSFHTSSLPSAPPPGLSRSPSYDVENLWQYEGAVLDGSSELALDYSCKWSISEKIHGCNFRMYRDPEGVVHIGSRNRWVKEEGGNVWWAAYRRYESLLVSLMAKNPNTIFFGEVFGKVQDLTYSESGVDLRLFDSYNTQTNRYNSIGDLTGMLLGVENAITLLVPTVSLFTGSLRMAIEEAKKLCSGKSLIDGTTMREGVVVRPVTQELLVFGKDPMRLMTKVVSPEYLSRLNGTEEH
jgi:RNA ligase (TIGR02306 family)